MAIYFRGSIYSTSLGNWYNRADFTGCQNFPGVEADPAEDELPKCVECFDDGFFEEASGVIKICHCSSEPKLSCQNPQRAIAPAAKNLPGSRSKASTAHQLLELFKS